MTTMTIERALRGIAGGFVLVSVLLGVLVSPWFLAFTAFVALNLIQSAFSNWCPMMWLLARLGVGCEAPRPAAPGPRVPGPGGGTSPTSSWW